MWIIRHNDFLSKKRVLSRLSCSTQNQTSRIIVFKEICWETTIKFRLKPIFFWNFKNVYFKTYKTFPQIFSQKSNRLSPQEKYLEWFWQAPYDARENSLNFIPFKLFESFKMFDSLKFSRKYFHFEEFQWRELQRGKHFKTFWKYFHSIEKLTLLW